MTADKHSLEYWTKQDLFDMYKGIKQGYPQARKALKLYRAEEARERQEKQGKKNDLYEKTLKSWQAAGFVQAVYLLYGRRSSKLNAALELLTQRDFNWSVMDYALRNAFSGGVVIYQWKDNPPKLHYVAGQDYTAEILNALKAVIYMYFENYYTEGLEYRGNERREEKTK